MTKKTLLTEWEQLVLPTQGERKVISIKYFSHKEKVAERPTLEEARKAWMAQKVPTEALPLLEREFQATQYLDKADSQTRQKLVDAGGWFPTIENLKLKDKSEASTHPIQVPQQIKDIINARRDNIDAFLHAPIQYTTTDL